MINKERTTHTFKGQMSVLLEVWNVVDMITLPISLVSAGGKFIGKEVAKEVGEELGEKAVKEVTEEAVEKTVKTEVSEEIAESAAKKEMVDTAEDLTQKTAKRGDVLEDSSGMRRESESQNIGSTSWEAKMPRTGEEWSKYFQDTYGAENIKWMPRSFKHMIENPQTLYGLTQSETAKILGQGWTASSYGKSGTGWKFINDASPDLMVFYHNADGVHGGAYYGFSSGLTGTVKLVGNDYIPLTGDKATIIQMKY